MDIIIKMFEDDRYHHTKSLMIDIITNKHIRFMMIDICHKNNCFIMIYIIIQNMYDDRYHHNTYVFMMIHIIINNTYFMMMDVILKRFLL